MGKSGCFSGFQFAWKSKTKVSPKGTNTYLMHWIEDAQVEPRDFFDLERLSRNAKVSRNDQPDNLMQKQTSIDAAMEENEGSEDISSFMEDSLNLKDFPEEKGDLKNDNNESNLELSKEIITDEELIQSGYISDPGILRATSISTSSVLRRYCSNIETTRANKIFESTCNSSSFNDLENLVCEGISSSPLSVMSSCSADKVLIIQKSSIKALPSQYEKPWRGLFLRSHSDLNKTTTSMLEKTTSPSNLKDCHSSDMLETSERTDIKKKIIIEEQVTSPQSHWLSFSSSLDRVNAWVHSIEYTNIYKFDGDEDDSDNDVEREPEETCACIRSAEIGESSGKNHSSRRQLTFKDVSHANNLKKSLNSHSSATQISNMGLKVIPTMPSYTSLRSVNLSGNMIAYISPGSLPRNLHSLDLSKNNITKIEGLKELTGLRIVNLSYNRISRIGQGLSNCTLVRELNLSGNKISDIEGLHRLLKLNVLDLSFNKIVTAQSLVLLAANYKSLLALNLMGNPIQKIVGDDQLKNKVGHILPKLAYLNKQHLKQQRTREVSTHSLAKAAIGNSGQSSRRRTKRQGSNIGGQGSVVGLKNRRQRSRK